MKTSNLFLMTLVYAASLSTISNDKAPFIPLSSSAKSSTNLNSSIEKNTMTEEKLFEQVPLDTNEQTACSPADPGFDWRGVVIRAPSRIVLPKENARSAGLIIPICGLYLVDVANTFRHPGPKKLVIYDETSGKTYTGPLVKHNIEPTIPPPRSRPVNPSTNAAFGSYFNVNAAAYITLPIQHARYRIKIEYAGYQSNEVVVSILEQP